MKTELTSQCALGLPPLLSGGELSAWHALLNDASSIVICTHKSPDGDALGSSLALCSYLMTVGKASSIVLPDGFPDFLQWLFGSVHVVRHDKNREEAERLLHGADVIFCLDMNTSARVASMQAALDASKARKIVLDHHEFPKIDASLLISKPHLSSTSEIVFRLVAQLDGLSRVDRYFLSCCYTGMMTDTGNFCYNNCSYPEFFQIIAYCVAHGVDKDKIYDRVYNSYSESCFRFRAYVISEKLRVNEEKHAAYFTVSRKELVRFKYIKGDAEGLVNEPLRIKGMRLSISLREDSEQPNLVWISLRSLSNFHCNRLAERYFNGGGHPNASGGKLFCSIEEAEQIVLRAIDAWDFT